MTRRERENYYNALMALGIAMSTAGTVVLWVLA